jgi:hypothetical protein
MGTESIFLIVMGGIGMLLAIALAASGYGKPVIGALSSASRKAINVTKRFLRRR